MAAPMSADRFIAVLRAEGLIVVEHRSWRTHNRNHKGAWGPVNGTMLHHTAGYESGAVDFCYDGDADLPGPLCHGVITKDGVVHLVGNGRTNHAGGGDPSVLQAVIDERYNETPPAPQRGNSNGVDGNAHFYGFECVNLGDGRDPWPAVQVDAMIRASAAISRNYGWTGKSAIGHKEWSRDKNDPRGPGDVVAMPRLRAKIAERLAHSASWNPGATTPPTTPGTPPVTVVKPLRQRLERTGPSNHLDLIPDVLVELYWPTTYEDDGYTHAAGAKTVATNVTYVSAVNLRLSGLPEDGAVEVYATEEDAGGNQISNGPSHMVRGRLGGGDVYETVPIVGFTGGRLVFEVVNRSSQVVTVTHAGVTSHFWPNL